MKNLTENVIDFEKTNPMALFYEFGFNPDDIKLSIIESFSNYFQNQENLREYAISDLVNNWVAYLTLTRDNPNSLEKISTILKIFNEAKRINYSETIKAYAYWSPEISQSIIRFWSLYNNQKNIDKLCIEDFLAEALNMIGGYIEGLSKPFFKLLLQLNRIRREKAYDFNEIKMKDLGAIIDELINTTDLDDLLIIKPNLIRLNQWRNIAYHHNSKVINGEILCSYKKDGDYNEFEISREELVTTLKNIILSFKLIRISEIIFCFDNLIDIQKSITENLSTQINVREESKLLDFYSAMTSQGFKVLELKYDSENALMRLQDLQEYPDFQKRAAHSSQFVHNLWIYTNSKKIIIEFYIFHGELFLTSEINSDDFIANTNSKLEISELLKNIKFTHFPKKYTQNKDPFRDLELNHIIKSQDQKFYSQQGKKISIKEFIKQFTLSVFNNYLAFKSEGLIGKINVGGDGSMIRTENMEKNIIIIIAVPAIIKNKELQLKIIEVLNIVIELYEKGELSIALVEEAKGNNKFYFKKQLIREQLKETKEKDY